MKHTKFIPSEFKDGLGSRNPTSYEKSNKKLIKDWVSQLNTRDCQVTEDALRKCLICWLHNRDCGVRDESFGFFIESKANKNQLKIEIYPLRDKPNATSYIGV